MQSLLKFTINNKKIREIFYKSLSVFLLFLISPLGTYATMSSTNYNIPIDSINFMSGDASSTNYNLNSTVGEVATGESNGTTNYDLYAGFQEPTDCVLTISDESDITMGSIAGTGQSALTTNSGTWTIATNCSTGYSLYWSASPASMTNTNGDTIAPLDVGASPAQWSVAAADSEWGGHLSYSSTTKDSKWGTDTTPTYASADTKWFNVATSNYLLASTNSSTTSDSEIIYFGAEVGSAHIQPSGSTYASTVTITVVTQ